MRYYLTFREYAEQRDAACRADTRGTPPGAQDIEPIVGSPTRLHPPDPDAAVDGGQVEQRSLLGNLFKGVFTVVNPSRPALPTNSRLLASPFRKRRLKSQVIGR